MENPSLRAVQLKTWTASAINARLEQALQHDIKSLAVTNRGRIVARLSLAEDMPATWQVTKPKTIPLSELKRGEISISRLRTEGRALYLAQRTHPTLALWPEDRDAGPSDFVLSEELAYLRQEVNRLRRRLDAIEGVEQRFADLGSTLVELFGNAADGTKARPGKRRSAKRTDNA